MDTESCKVLVQIDDAGRVTAINSDAFVSGDGWTQIDEGEGDRYRHAQNNYLLKPRRVPLQARGWAGRAADTGRDGRGL